MRYQGTVYRPPSEAGSLIIQATIGCPHNKCNFCAMYRDKKFKIRKTSEIKEDLDRAKEYYGEEIKTVFFADGNTILMKTQDLLEIFTYTQRLFPRLERITVYGSARYIGLKSLEEYKRLKDAGLCRIHSGMESGDDEVLKFINKGTCSSEIIKSGQHVKEAGLELSQYLLIGVGGRELSGQHAVNSADVINQINPDFIRIRTFLPYPGTPMYEMYKEGSFLLLQPYQALRELRLFIENLQGINSLLLSDHALNYWNVNGRLPHDKEAMLEEIDYALNIDQAKFRNPEEGYL
ncbi:MAG: radical SAM protein [Bacillota bacterium]